MTQTDMQDAQLKRCMVASAGRVVALVDASKFGKTDLTPFARVDQLVHVLTDSDVNADFVQELRRMGVTVSVCGENTVSSYVPLNQEDGHYRVGFANLGEDQSVFAVDVRHGLEQAARTLATSIWSWRTIVSMVKSRAHGSQPAGQRGHQYRHAYRIDEYIGGLVASKFHEANIPVIAVDIPMVGATYFGVDNYRAGQMAGVALGQWIEQHWQGRLDRVLNLQHKQAGSLPAARIRGQWEGLQSVLPYLSPDQTIYSNDGATAHDFEHYVTQALQPLPAMHKVAILSFNDNATMGALRAVRSLQREESVAIVGQGANRQVRKEIRAADSPVIGATAFLARTLWAEVDRACSQDPSGRSGSTRSLHGSRFSRCIQHRPLLSRRWTRTIDDSPNTARSPLHLHRPAERRHDELRRQSLPAHPSHGQPGRARGTL